jgi:2-polyprenyl-6-methoxyphenol hydroxylase-like FAD-dependent oxidoreductase
MTDRSLRILIIGASPEGACLAHGLKRAGLGVAVYERDRRGRADSFGSRVLIGADGSRALRDALPPDLYQTFIATCAEPPRHLTVYSEELNELFSDTLPAADNHGEEPVARLSSASALILRQLLLTGIEDVVQFEKEFVRYERRLDGKVAAFFADGTSAVGDVLVGADGWQSRVRRQYTPHAEVQDYGMVATTGQVALHEAARVLPHEKMLRGISVVCGHQGQRFIAQSMEFKWDREGNLKGNVNSFAAALITTWPGALHDTTGDHLMWGLMTTSRMVPSGRQVRHGTELVAAVASVTSGWHPAMATLIKLTDPATAAAAPVLISYPAGPREATEVTLLGGASHARIPDAGAGITAALHAAGMLCHLLAEAVREHRPVASAIHDYETHVLRSGNVPTHAYSKCLSRKRRMKATVLGPVFSAGVHTRLRVANRVPALKRQVTAEFGWVRGGE